METMQSRQNKAFAIVAAAQNPADLPHVEARVRNACLFYPLHAPSQRDAVIQLLHDAPHLAEIFVFHGDGHLREAALHRLASPCSGPASVYALFSRLNDWAIPVRRAAAAAIARCLPITPAPVITPAIKALVPVITTWRRWSHEGPQALDDLLMRRDVAALILSDILQSREAGVGQMFRALSINPWIDQHLDQIACSARQPNLRAMASHAIFSQTVVWPARKMRRIWVDRSMGLYRQEPVFHDRALSVAADRGAMINAAARDRSGMVRRSAADAMIALRHEAGLALAIETAAHLLTDDPNIGVQRRMQFLRQKLDQEKGAGHPAPLSLDQLSS